MLFASVVLSEVHMPDEGEVVLGIYSRVLEGDTHTCFGLGSIRMNKAGKERHAVAF